MQTADLVLHSQVVASGICRLIHLIEGIQLQQHQRTNTLRTLQSDLTNYGILYQSVQIKGNSDTVRTNLQPSPLQNGGCVYLPSGHCKNPRCWWIWDLDVPGSANPIIEYCCQRRLRHRESTGDTGVLLERFVSQFSTDTNLEKKTKRQELFC